MTILDTVDAPAKPLRVLTLDGGGAKGFYTLGVLKEIEAMSGCPLHEKFDLIFGTSTGSIIAALIALGKTVEEILALYTCGPAGGGGVRSSTRRRIATSSAFIARDKIRTAVDILS